MLTIYKKYTTFFFSSSAPDRNASRASRISRDSSAVRYTSLMNLSTAGLPPFSYTSGQVGHLEGQAEVRVNKHVTDSIAAQHRQLLNPGADWFNKGGGLVGPEPPK